MSAYAGSFAQGRRRYELAPTRRCVPGSQICSGRGGGAGCQSKALSTIWCIWWNHQRAVKGDEGRQVRQRLSHARAAEAQFQLCISHNLPFSFCAQPRSVGWTNTV